VGGLTATTTLKGDLIMAKKGKKYQEAVKLVDKNKVYEVAGSYRALGLGTKIDI